jgi:hypothetical protein
MIFHKHRSQAARIWDAKKNKVSIIFQKQTRDPLGIDGFYETENKTEIRLLKKMGYSYDPEPEPEVEG